MMHQNFQSFNAPPWVFEDSFCSKVVEDANDTRVGLDEAVTIASLLGIAQLHKGRNSGKFKCGLSVLEASRMISDRGKQVDNNKRGRKNGHDERRNVLYIRTRW
jgi:hypothetical protein